MTVVAEAVVRVRADTSTFKQEAEAGARKGLTGLQADAVRTEAAFKKMTVQGQIAVVNRKDLALSTAQVTKVTVDFLQAQRALLAAEFNSVVGIDDATAALRFQEIQAIDTKLALAGVTDATTKAGKAGSLFRSRLGGRETGGVLSLLRSGGPQLFAALAAFQAFTKLTQALRVTGDEAFTTEGKLRNLSASLLTGDIVGAVQGVFADAPKLSDDIAKATTEMRSLVSETSRLGLQDVVDQTQKWRDYVKETGTVYEPIFQRTAKLTVDTAATTEKTEKLRNDLRLTALYATQIAPLIAKFPTPLADADAKAKSLGTAFRQGAADAALMLEYLTEIGRLDLADKLATPTFGITPLGPGAKVTDKTASQSQSFANSQSIASRTKALNDDLVQAKKEAAIAAQTEKNLQDQVQGRARRRAATIAAETTVIRLGQQLADQQKQAADKRAADAKADAVERERLAKERADALAKEKAEALAAYKGRQDLALLKIRNAQAIADLDGKVTARDIALKKKEIVALGKLANDRKRYTDLEREQFKSEQIQARADLKALKEGKAGGDSATPEDFFSAAVANFKSFGGGTSGILSGQDARGSLAGRVLGTTTAGRGIVGGGSRVPPADPIADAASENTKRLGDAASQQLTESRKQTRYLQIIAKQTTRLGKAAVVAGAAADTRSRN